MKVLARRFGIGQWSFIRPGSEKKWYSSENSPQGAWVDIAEQMLLEFAESGHPTFPCHDSVVHRYSQEQRTWKTVNTLRCRCGHSLIQFIASFFLSISSVSTEQVAAVCEEFESHQDRSGEPEILMGSINCSRRN